jgi:hypothetical protein
MRQSQSKTFAVISGVKEQQNGRHSKSVIEAFRHSFSKGNRTHPINGSGSESEAGCATVSRAGAMSPATTTSPGTTQSVQSSSSFLEAWLTASVAPSRKGSLQNNMVRQDIQAPPPAARAPKLLAIASDQQMDSSTALGVSSAGGSTSDLKSPAPPDASGPKGAARLMTPLRGLRVRMGVATGWLPSSSDIMTCALFELAKGVSATATDSSLMHSLEQTVGCGHVRKRHCVNNVQVLCFIDEPQ